MAGESGAVILTLEVPGLPRVVRAFETAGKAVGDLSAVWTAVAQDLMGDAQANFYQQGGVFSYGFTGQRGSAWAPLAASTVRERIRKGFGPVPIEVRSGLLEGSLTERGSAGNITDIQPLGFRWGTAIYYAAFQHFQTRRSPARPLLGLTRERQQRIVAAIRDHIFAVIRNAGVGG